jgi:cellobiose transport system permease protein
LPQVTSLVAVALIFSQLFSRDYGVVNYVLGGVGMHHVDWEAGRLSSWIALSVMVTWRWTGYNALIYLAAMQGIPEELYEAAAIDGAKGWRQFRHVTVPMLRPTIIFTVIVSTIGGLQLFTEPYLFEPLKQGATGGSARQYQTVVMYLYEKAFGSTQFDFGYAAAIGWALFLLIALFSLVNFLIVRRIRSAES